MKSTKDLFIPFVYTTPLVQIKRGWKAHETLASALSENIVMRSLVVVVVAITVDTLKKAVVPFDLPSNDAPRRPCFSNIFNFLINGSFKYQQCNANFILENKISC